MSKLSIRSDIGFYNSEDAYPATVSAIDQILAVLPTRDNWCVEFGAWDGIHVSCTRNLIVNHGYFSVQIEGDRERCAQLKENYAGVDRVKVFNLFVGLSKDDNLDSILARTDIPPEFDFCCIDIDGNDYHIWKSMTRYRPKVICIEFNPTIPPEVNFVQSADPIVNHGCSLTALVELAAEKNYELVAAFNVNAYFVQKQYFPLYEIADNSIPALWKNQDCVTYFFTGYDGQVFLHGCRKLPWHEGNPIRESDVQILPKFLRIYPYQRRRQILYNCLIDPRKILGVIKRRLNQKR